MTLVLVNEDGDELARIPFNTVQVIRCIKRNRTGEAPPDGWPPITDVDIANYALGPIIATGESWKAQMQIENERLLIDSVRESNGDAIAASALWRERIAKLDDPAK